MLTFFLRSATSVIIGFSSGCEVDSVLSADVGGFVHVVRWASGCVCVWCYPPTTGGSQISGCPYSTMDVGLPASLAHLASKSPKQLLHCGATEICADERVFVKAL